jgi:cytochrome c-type biogenesis protein CcmH/NrfG
MATAAYRRAMSLAPERINVLLLAGRFFMNNGQPEEARAAFEHVLSLEPTNEKALLHLGQLPSSPQNRDYDE